MAAPWTKARLNAFIIAALRKATSRYPPKYECLAEAYVGQKVNPKTGREGKHYLCATCCGEFPAKEVNVDHIDPVVQPTVGFISWDDYIARLFCDKDSLQVLCKECHTIKSKEENNGRKKSNKD